MIPKARKAIPSRLPSDQRADRRGLQDGRDDEAEQHQPYCRQGAQRHPVQGAREPQQREAIRADA